MPCYCCGDYDDALPVYPVVFKYTKKSKKFDACLVCLTLIDKTRQFIGINQCPKRGDRFLLNDYSPEDVDELLEDESIPHDMHLNLQMFKRIM